MSEEKQIVKEYSNDEVVIIWQPHLCQHSGNCVKNLSTVFNPKNRPWINPQAASGTEITKAVDTCPSGALSYRKKQAS